VVGTDLIGSGVRVDEPVDGIGVGRTGSVVGAEATESEVGTVDERASFTRSTSQGVHASAISISPDTTATDSDLVHHRLPIVIRPSHTRSDHASRYAHSRIDGGSRSTNQT